ncbi:hypothetical protein Q8F55_003866 [Vanrija albida]|uniref:GS catalytic domain-containing protein n=1 Tax=Vanrija albida TaxID=181172 RepID=A0ABR3Q5X7_9TREE
MPPSATQDAPRTLAELTTLLKDDRMVKVAGVDVDGVLRGKVMSKSKFLSSIEAFGFCGVVYGWDMHDQTYSRELLVSNRGNGYRDILARVDLATYRRLPWENNIPFFLVSFTTPETGLPLEVDPRSLLETVLEKATDKGWTGMAGAEFEYFQFAETPQSAHEKGFINLTALTPGAHGYSLLRTTMNKDYFYDLYNVGTDFGIEIEGHHTETGPGVFETALAYTDALRMADNALLFKLVAKSVGYKYNIIPSFMAKPYSDESGCSGHIHVSLRDKNRRNIFAVTDEEAKSGGRKNAAFDDLKYLSQEAEWFLAGLLEGLPDVIPLFCPNINSYKRLLGGEQYWAPDTASYGYDSRAASIRIISAPGVKGPATRFEVRIPGADMNTHFALAAIYGLGLRGIENKTKLPYGPIGSPGVTRETLVKLPTSLDAATAAFARKGSIAREVLGDFFVDHYAGTREHELDLHRKAVTNWELERYLELA